MKPLSDFFSQSRNSVPVKVLLLLVIIAGGGACSTSSMQTVSGSKEQHVSWDFDHEVQYKQAVLSPTSYQLEVVPNNKVSFERLTSFLIRKSLRLCQHYGYQLKILDGVESYDHYRASPNLIMGNLTAKLDCAPQ